MKAPKPPVRLQLSRKDGFNLAALSKKANGRECVKVDRSSPWGNPNVVIKEGAISYSVNSSGDFATREAAAKHAVALHAAECEQIAGRVRAHLGGKNLACWCGPDDVCHADTLLRIANGGAT